jgi:N-acetylmuramoyl-L-alanine amidase
MKPWFVRMPWFLLLTLSSIRLEAAGPQPKVGERSPRTGDEIMVCGQLFHTTTKVVLWTDPGGYDAYRVEARFAPMAGGGAQAKQKVGATEPAQESRYNLRKAGLTPEQIEQVRGGGWDLPLLQKVVDQFVIHFDAVGTSRGCFEVLQDKRILSVHFMLDLDGTIYQTLDLKERAWHATIANSRSIGIEVANIGAYPVGAPNPLGQWYRVGGDGKPVIVVPKASEKASLGQQFPNLRPARDEKVTGVVQGERLEQYDFTPQQYEAIARLSATLCTIFPKIRCDYPRDASGSLVSTKLPADVYDKYQGILGHFHVQTNKVDPGPAFQWDRVISEARSLMAR